MLWEFISYTYSSIPIEIPIAMRTVYVAYVIEYLWYVSHTKLLNVRVFEKTSTYTHAKSYHDRLGSVRNTTYVLVNLAGGRAELSSLS